MAFSGLIFLNICCGNAVTETGVMYHTADSLFLVSQVVPKCPTRHCVLITMYYSSVKWTNFRRLFCHSAFCHCRLNPTLPLILECKKCSTFHTIIIHALSGCLKWTFSFSVWTHYSRCVPIHSSNCALEGERLTDSNARWENNWIKFIHKTVEYIVYSINA